MTNERLAAILLAAGESTRMGRLKQLLRWDGDTLIAWQVAQLRDAGATEIVVVLGHAAEQIRPAVPPGARVTVNEAYKTGRASSLRRGAEALGEPVNAVLILSVDQPRPSWVSRLLIDRWRETRAAIVSPRFGAHYGHPILIDGSLVAELRAVTDETLGLRAVIDRHVSNAEAVDVSNTGINVDLNTPADYEAASEAFRAGAWNPTVT
jgi:molybdenum cofactor cytidylyltransferase